MIYLILVSLNIPQKVFKMNTILRIINNNIVFIYIEYFLGNISIKIYNCYPVMRFLISHQRL